MTVICTIEFIQPSTAAGCWLLAEGEYSIVGEIHHPTSWNGQATVVGPYQLGSISGQAAITQLPVVTIEMVGCSTSARQRRFGSGFRDDSTVELRGE